MSGVLVNHKPTSKKPNIRPRGQKKIEKSGGCKYACKCYKNEA